MEKRKRFAELDSFNELMLAKMYRPLTEIHEGQLDVQVFVAEEIYKNGLSDEVVQKVWKDFKLGVHFEKEDGEDVIYHGCHGEVYTRDYNIEYVYRGVYDENMPFPFQIFICGYQGVEEVHKEKVRPFFDSKEYRAYIKYHFNSVFYPYDSRSFKSEE